MTLFRPIKKATTDVSILIYIIDSTTGIPEQAVEHDSGGIALWYRRDGAAVVAITEAALAAADSAHSDGGIEHLDDGCYRLDLPDAACAAGVNGVLVGGAVTGMIVIPTYVPLVDYDPYDTVRMGLTALPNAAANAAGGLVISAAGSLAMDTQLANTNEITAARMGALTDWINGGRLDLLLDAIPTTAMRGTDSAALAALWTEARAEALTDWINGGRLDLLLDAIPTTAMRGTDDAATAAVWTAARAGALTDWINGGRLDLLIDAIKVTTDSLTDLQTLVDAIWDEVLTGASHNGATTAGRRLRQAVDASIIVEGEAQAGAAGTITLAAGASAVNDFYDHCMIVLTADTGVGQARSIEGYNGGTKVATVHPNWATNPAAGTDYIIFAFSEAHVHHVESGAIGTGAIDSIALGEIQAEMEEDGASLLDIIRDELANGTDGLSALKALIDTLQTAVTAVKAKTDNLPEGIQKNQAFDIGFMMVDATDHVTPEPSLTVAGTVSIDGGAFGGVAGSFAEIGNGAYRFSGLAADSNGDDLIFRFTSAGAAATVIAIVTNA